MLGKPIFNIVPIHLTANTVKQWVAICDFFFFFLAMVIWKEQIAINGWSSNNPGYLQNENLFFLSAVFLFSCLAVNGHCCNHIPCCISVKKPEPAGRVIGALEWPDCRMQLHSHFSLLQLKLLHLCCYILSYYTDFSLLKCENLPSLAWLRHL